MMYLAVSATNQCGYCIASHTAAARKAGMTDAMLAELMAVVGMANESNRLASGYQVEIDERFKTRPADGDAAVFTTLSALRRSQTGPEHARKCLRRATRGRRSRPHAEGKELAKMRALRIGWLVFSVRRPLGRSHVH